ncbi:hypothetical protein BCR34DRAFT_580156 [Clohesyomyces aquaticus]|uniref:Alpha/Beta hydrolase protein n=1 Tax=Clohesyomyces aquaticus TaxID=1231657 RepID=A0A1Y1Y846_9PLEO|nr:hypothetical protein BCR34DRAFT_580156 [Clohesyomyces aquaticus]
MFSLKAIIGPRPTGILTMGPAFLEGGLQAGGTEGVTINSPAPAGNINSFKNKNPPPPTSVFPSADPADAPYSVSEDKLRAAIFIPPNFRSVGMTPNPVILVPGTGAFGGVNYEGNFAKIFAQNASIAQAVWLNVPGAMYDDVQTNAEYIAYAMNYISKMTGTKVSVIGWSQGNLASQWAIKYWPSTRQSTKQLIIISPDFHGTTIANIADFPLIDQVPLPPLSHTTTIRLNTHQDPPRRGRRLGVCPHNLHVQFLLRRSRTAPIRQNRLRLHPRRARRRRRKLRNPTSLP